MEEKSFSKLKRICLIYKDKIKDLCIQILQENFSKYREGLKLKKICQRSYKIGLIINIFIRICKAVYIKFEINL